MDFGQQFFSGVAGDRSIDNSDTRSGHYTIFVFCPPAGQKAARSPCGQLKQNTTKSRSFQILDPSAGTAVLPPAAPPGADRKADYRSGSHTSAAPAVPPPGAAASGCFFPPPLVGHGNGPGSAPLYPRRSPGFGFFCSIRIRSSASSRAVCQ